MAEAELLYGTKANVKIRLKDAIERYAKDINQTADQSACNISTVAMCIWKCLFFRLAVSFHNRLGDADRAYCRIYFHTT